MCVQNLICLSENTSLRFYLSAAFLQSALVTEVFHIHHQHPGFYQNQIIGR